MIRPTVLEMNPTDGRVHKPSLENRWFKGVLHLRGSSSKYVSRLMGYTAGIFLALALVCPRPGYTASNTAVDAGGGDISLSASGPVIVNGLFGALVKQARDLSGTVIPDGSDVNSGQDIYFVLYLDNFTSARATNIKIIDLLDETAFTYVLNSIETTLVPSGSNDAAIWAGTWTPLSDNVNPSPDLASITDSGGGPRIRPDYHWVSTCSK